MKHAVCFAVCAAVLMLGCNEEDANPASSGGGADYDAALTGTWIQCDTSGVLWPASADTVRVTSAAFTYIAVTSSVTSTSFPPATQTAGITYGLIASAGNIGYSMSFNNTKSYQYDYTIIGNLLLLKTEMTVAYTALTKATATFVFKKS